jgi:hypothetical protein
VHSPQDLEKERKIGASLSTVGLGVILIGLGVLLVNLLPIFSAPMVGPVFLIVSIVRGLALGGGAIIVGVGLFQAGRSLQSK